MNSFNYQKWIEEGFVEVVKKALADFKNNSKLGNHFYITLNTKHPKLQISSELKKEYPEEITIVIEKKFENIEIKDDCFAITLFFNKQPERLSVPYSSMLTFLDPFVNIGFNFTTHEMEDNDQAKVIQFGEIKKDV